MPRYKVTDASMTIVVEADRVEFTGPWVIFWRFDPIDSKHCVEKAIKTNDHAMMVEELRE